MAICVMTGHGFTKSLNKRNRDMSDSGIKIDESNA